MKLKQAYIDMPYCPQLKKTIWTYFNKPGQHCNKHDRYSHKWKPQVHLYQSRPGIYSLMHDRDDIMWEKIKFECVNSFDADCSNPNSFECKKRRHYQCSAPDTHFPFDVDDKELVNHLAKYHPKDFEEFLGSVKLTLENKIEFNKNSKNNLKLSHGIKRENKQNLIIRFPFSRRNPVRNDKEDDDNINMDNDDSMDTTIKEAYHNNPVGSYAGNYDRPVGSQGYNAYLPDTFKNFVNYRHNPTNSCHIFDINQNKYKYLDLKEKIDSYIIKEEAFASTIAGPVTEINNESVVYTCQEHKCQFPCLCHICVKQNSECNTHKFKHPALFDKKNDHLLLRTPHNFDINDFTRNTFKKCYSKNEKYLGYDEPVEQVYFYAGIKKDCAACTNDLYYHSAYHFVYHDKCKFCRFSSYRFEGITMQKEFCERVEERIFEEKSSCHLCYKMFSSEKRKNSHIQIVHQNGGDFLCDSCGRIYGSQISLEYHLSNQHRNEEQWMCKICLKTFNLKHSLNVHMKNVHDRKTFLCKICSKVFKRLSHFLRHQKYYHGVFRSYFILDEYPDIQYHNCDHCSFKSRYKKNLCKHIETIHGYVEFPCSACGFISNRQDNLKRHINTIHGDVKYKCNECEFISNRNDAFIRHTDTIHGDEKKFFCTDCDSVFKRKDKRKHHVETAHTEEFKHSCNKCEFVSKSKDHMKRHVETAHTEEFKHSCNKCEFVSKRKDHMKRHIATKHIEEFQYSCKECNYLSKRKDNMKRHVETVHTEIKHEDNMSHHYDSSLDKTWIPNQDDEDLDPMMPLKEIESSVMKEEEESSLNQTWHKRKSLNQTLVRSKEENFSDVDGDFDKTWIPNSKDDEI